MTSATGSLIPAERGDSWPPLPYPAWKDTCQTLQLWMQIVGKIRGALTPWVNHSWHVPLYLTANGLTTGPIASPAAVFEIDFDFLHHKLSIRNSDGKTAEINLHPVSVAAFYNAVMAKLQWLGIDVQIDPMPNEIPDAIAFPEDQVHASYDADAAQRFWRVLLSSHLVFSHFRTGFLGKVSRVHFFWGSFDLAITRFSGRKAPPHPGGIPHLSNEIVREAYSHEVSSAGFWPGGGVIEEPAYYSYAYPAPPGFASAPVRPSQAYFHETLGEFILPYEAVRTAPDPAVMLMDFLQSTYVAAADLGNWDRAELECEFGVPRRPRRV